MHTVLQWFLIVLRVAFGALFAFSGLNHFFYLWQPPAPTTPQSQIFIQGLLGSGYLIPPRGAIDTLSGLALITNRFVPLALVVLAAPAAAIRSQPVTSAAGQR